MEENKTNLKNEIINAITNNHIYDYMANNYYKIDKDTLKNILLEYIYLFDNNNKTELLNNIKDRI